MLTFVAFLGCTILFGLGVAVVSLPAINRLLHWQQMRVIRRTARRIGRDEVLAAAERQRTTPGLSCSSPDPVLAEIQSAAVRNCQRMQVVAGPILTGAYLLAGAALSAWLFYL